MKLDDIKNLDFNNVSNWPVVIQVIAVLLVCGMLGGGGYWFVIKGQVEALEIVEAKEDDLRIRFEARQRKAAGLDLYKVQLAEMEERFGHMLRQLPGKKEVASLVQDVSQLRVSSGLEEQLFQPEKEIKRDFYAELPIKITLEGGFHQYGDFAHGVAALPRIVTLHDIVIKRAGSKRRGSEDGGSRLVMNAKAKTYRYLEDGE